MVEILTYKSDDKSTFTRELEFYLGGCEECNVENGNMCYVDGVIPERGDCPLVFKNLINRSPKN